MDTAMYYTGTRLHKRTAYLTTVDEEGKIAAQKKLPCRREALRLYFRHLSGSHRAAVETTTGWYWVSDLLSEEGVTLKLAHAKRCERKRSSTLGVYLKAIAYDRSHEIYHRR